MTTSAKQIIATMVSAVKKRAVEAAPLAQTQTKMVVALAILGCLETPLSLVWHAPETQSALGMATVQTMPETITSNVIVMMHTLVPHATSVTRQYTME